MAPRIPTFDHRKNWFNHHYMNSANQGFFWWEIDMSYILLRILAVFGVNIITYGR